MKKILSILLSSLLLACAQQQQTPSQILEAGSAFQSVSPQGLEISKATLLSYLVYGQVISPSTILANGASFQALDDRSIQICIAQLLNQWSASASSVSSTLLNPPHVGPGQSRSGLHSIHNQSSLLNSDFMRIGGTNGIVRGLYIVPDLNNDKGLFQNPCQVGLRIYPDCGAVSSVAGLTPAFDCPLGNMTLNKYRFPTNSNVPYSVIFQSAFLDVITSFTNTVYRTNITTLKWKTPIYFSNDCVFQLYDYTNNRAWSNGYFSASYELSPSALSFPNSNYRLRSTNYLGSPDTGTINTLIDLSSVTNGLLVGFTTQVLNTTNADDMGFFDTWTPFFETGTAGVYWEPTGGDDLTGSTYALSATGQFTGSDWGVVNYWINPADGSGMYATENYRWLVNDNFTWNNGLVVKFRPGTKINQYVFTIFYYSP